MNKWVKLCIAATMVLFVGAVISAALLYRSTDNTKVEIIRDGEVLYVFDLDREPDRKFRIDFGDGYNEVEIIDGKIHMTDGDCPDKVCVKTGFLRSEGVPIVCLPHHLVIRYSEAE